jgi:hypothetical protein
MKFSGIALLLTGFAIFAFIIPYFSYRRIARVWNHPKIISFSILFIGLLAGYFLSTWVWTYSPTTKISGFPLPLAVFKLEDSHWIDYVIPFPASLMTMLLNLLIVSCFIFFIAVLTSFLFHGSNPKAEQGAAANP